MDFQARGSSTRKICCSFRPQQRCTAVCVLLLFQFQLCNFAILAISLLLVEYGFLEERCILKTRTVSQHYVPYTELDRENMDWHGNKSQELAPLRTLRLTKTGTVSQHYVPYIEFDRENMDWHGNKSSGDCALAHSSIHEGQHQVQYISPSGRSSNVCTYSGTRYIHIKHTHMYNNTWARYYSLTTCT